MCAWRLGGGYYDPMKGLLVPWDQVPDPLNKREDAIALLDWMKENCTSTRIMVAFIAATNQDVRGLEA